MAWQIDDFSVKPSGFAARWRDQKVYVDENGNLSSYGDVNQCISDYRKKSRRYSDNQLITEFCNTDTFTNYRVYASNCHPFAYVQTDINAPKCGYLEPLPTPAVPSSPFSAAVYGVYKFFEFKSVEGVDYLINIYKKDFAGTATRIDLGDSDPVIFSYSSEDEDNKFSPIRACECELSFMCNENFDLQELYTADERAFKVVVLNGSEIKFSGFVIPDSCSEPFTAPPYPVSIRATDGLGTLKNITYPIPIGSKINIRQSFKDILCYCLAMTNLNLDLLTICNLYEAKMLTGIDDDPLAQAQVNPLRLSDNQGNIKSCYDVLIDICTLFGAYMVQSEGRWTFVRLNELSNAVVRGRLYMYTGFFKRSFIVENARTASNTNDDVTVLSGGELRTANAYKRVIVLTEFGNSATALYNGDFELWDGQNFKYWTRYGGLNISRVQKTVTGTGGAKIGIEDYACQFNEQAHAGKWLESAPIVIQKGDKIKFSYFFGTEISPEFVLLKFRFIIGQYQLTGDVNYRDTDAPLEWVSQQTRVRAFNSARYADINTNSSSFDLPEAPEDGTLVIQLYSGDRYRVNENFSVSWKPVQLDNITIAKSSKVEKNEKDGFWSISEQLGFYTNTPEDVKLSYSDSQVPTPGPVIKRILGRDRIVSPGGVTDTLALATLYAIYTTDNSFSTVWKDYNESGAPLPISLNLARTILKAYQKPFRYYQGDFKGDNLNYLNVFNFNVADNAEFSARTFAIMSGDFSLKYHQLTNATLAEIFSKPVFTTNYQTPHSPGQVPPAITQNPNNPINPVRVFSNEFTSEFS